MLEDTNSPNRGAHMKNTALLLGIVGLVVLAHSMDAQDKDSGKAIDPATIAAFKKAGWTYGGWKDVGGLLYFYSGNRTDTQATRGFLLQGLRYDARNKPPEVA